MQYVRNIVLVIIFSVILITPAVGYFIDFFPDVKIDENRKIKDKPIFDIHNLEIYPIEFDEYYTDNFTLRNELLYFNSRFKIDILKTPPVKKALLTSDNWMYSFANLESVYLGKDLATQAELSRFYNIFNYRKNLLDSINCSYYIVIAPVKSTIYPEHIDNYYGTESDSNLTDQLVNLLDTVQGLTFIDLRAPLKRSKEVMRLYHKTDTHWNKYGSFIGYQEIAKSLSSEFEQINPMSINDFIIDSSYVQGMNLRRLLGIYHDFYEWDITLKPKDGFKAKKGLARNYEVPKFSLSYEYERVYSTGDEKLPKMLMIRDSYARAIIPYLSEHFNESVYIFDNWHHDLNEEILIKEKPDIFIQLILESQLRYLHNNSKKP